MQQPLELTFGSPLNDNAPKAGSSRYLDMAERWAAERDCRHLDAAQWIRGLAGGLHHLDSAKHGFRPDDIVHVAQAWHGSDFDVWRGGFVLDLKGGRRARMECFSLLRDWTDPDESAIRVTIEPADYDEKTSNPWDPDHRLFEDGADLP